MKGYSDLIFPKVYRKLTIKNAQIPHAGDLIVNKDGILYPLFLAVSQVGSIVVPISSMIVGSELHRSLTEADRDEEEQLNDSHGFGMPSVWAIIALRLIVLPWIGRSVHGALGLFERIPNRLLSVFTTVEWSVPTANNVVIMVAIVAENRPVLGRRLREDVSKCLFWQYMLLPVFLTLNTTLALRMDFPAS